mgnify:CR=1 FL=1
MKVAARRDKTHNPSGETCWVSRLRENFTSGSYGEGLETGRDSISVPRQSFTRQTAFQELEAHLHSEINSLGYPKAALFGFCVALVAYNVLAVVKAALRSVHGEERIANEVSGYYLAGHLGRTYDGMMIAVPEEEWVVFQGMSSGSFTHTLQQLANKVNLEKFKKHKRGPKKPRTKRNQDSNQPHVSTARLIKK